MSSLRQVWMKWKMLRLPWRKSFLIGEDLAGNTFWEFKDALNYNRMRRIVKSRGRVHHGDVQISPQWHQWLRQTRIDPPTIQEQHKDLARQVQLKHNARLADERWAAKARYIEKPKEMPRGTTAWFSDQPGAQQTSEQASTQTPNVIQSSGISSEVTSPAEESQRQETVVSKEPRKLKLEDGPVEQGRQRPKQTGSIPGADWQPESWTPGSRNR